MKRILYTSWYTGLGGGETDLLTLAGALDHSRFAPQLLVPANGKLCQRWRAEGWSAHVLPYRGASTWFVPSLWARFPVVRRMEDLLVAQNIDLVHSDYHTLPFIAAAARRLGLPLLWTVWGWWFKPKVWQRAFFRSLPAVARSRAIRDGFVGSPPFMPPDHLPVIYTGVDSARFRPGLGRGLRRELDIADDALVVAMVARFQPVKGHHFFQAMAEQVLAALPETRFIVAGDDVFGVSADQRYREQILERAAQRPALRDSLQYIGFRDDIESVYAAADVFVCPSDFESYGIANLEAMACGRPVVSTGRGGPSETIAHGETGFLVDAGDVDALSASVLRLLNDADLRKKMGVAGRRRMLKTFSIAAAADAHMQLYERLLR
ncbi:MAG: glycosyltransferase family 4 protein [Chloroflexi bacterium]|nr:glycosyltransferase family 4 protein [Chloroflexota bacterium]